jgi:hypothetical protein
LAVRQVRYGISLLSRNNQENVMKTPSFAQFADRTRHLTAQLAIQAVGVLTLAGAMSTSVHAAYVRAELSQPVLVEQVYANEWGSPFVTFTTAVNAVCSSTRGLYLWNLEVTPNAQLRNAKLALVLTAKSTGRRLRLDYFYDSSKTGWEACYIHGLYLQD